MSTQNSELIRNLQEPECYEHPIDRVRIHETHISWILLTGSFAYKIKKPVDLGFVDFTSLEKRKFYCEEELRLNQRFASKLYLDVVSITGSVDEPRVNGDGNPIDYAVKMVEFSQDNLFSNLAETGKLNREILLELADEVELFHRNAETITRDQEFGSPDEIFRDMEDNFQAIETENSEWKERLDKLEELSHSEYNRLESIFRERFKNGRVRECHGDLHLENIVLWEGDPTLFDCIEFNEEFRWIDVVNEVAFLCMDLGFHNQEALAFDFLSRYFALSGDYEGIELLRFYLAYRAMVRAKINWIEYESNSANATYSKQEFEDHLRLAHKYLSRNQDQEGLLITHGFSGSGKSTVTRQILGQLSAFRIRSDLERKRLAGLDAREAIKKEISDDRYKEEMTRKTYRRLKDIAEKIIRSGHRVIVDATFLKKNWRDEFRALAEETSVPFVILDMQASESTLRKRVSGREESISDATEGVLESQLKTADPIEPSEEEYCFEIDTEQSLKPKKLMGHLKERLS